MKKKIHEFIQIRRRFWWNFRFIN